MSAILCCDQGSLHDLMAGEWLLLARELKCLRFCFVNVVKFITVSATGINYFGHLKAVQTIFADDICGSLCSPTKHGRANLRRSGLRCPPRSPWQGQLITLTPTVTPKLTISLSYTVNCHWQAIAWKTPDNFADPRVRFICICNRVGPRAIKD